MGHPREATCTIRRPASGARHWCVVWAILAGFVHTGCGVDDGPIPCIAGESAACDCGASGLTGVHTCGPDKRFGPCDCGGNAAGSTSVGGATASGTGGVASTGTGGVIGTAGASATGTGGVGTGTGGTTAMGTGGTAAGMGTGTGGTMAMGTGGTAAGTAGTGTGGTGPVCDLSGPDCAQCQAEKCCSELETCAADSTCACIAECVGESGLGSVDMCKTRCGGASAPFAPLASCLMSQCPDSDECNP